MLGTHPGYGASRGAKMLAEAPDLAARKVEVWACDVEQLAEQGQLERVDEFEGHALYDERQLVSPTAAMCAALEQILDFSRAVTGTLFFVPSADFLKYLKS